MLCDSLFWFLYHNTTTMTMIPTTQVMIIAITHPTIIPAGLEDDELPSLLSIVAITVDDKEGVNEVDMTAG